MPGAGNYQIPNSPTATSNTPFSHAAPQHTGTGAASSFLGNLATTAAGVVAGSFLYQGIENLMGVGHHQAGGWQQVFDEHQPIDRTVINNYYGDSDKPEKTDNSNNSIANNDSGSFFDDNFDNFFDGSSDFDDTDDSGWV